MEKNLAHKQEQLIKVFKNLTEAMPKLRPEEHLRMAFTYVFTAEPDAVEPDATESDPRIKVLRELRLRNGISQGKASVGIGKGKTYVLRMESGKAILDKPTEKKLLEFYKKHQEEAPSPLP